ncbi:MAG: extracellular solute-binding protein [Eubacteriales bacterium]|nr:extracellular solute-binding protein [Eubacteriales bacterium]
MLFKRYLQLGLLLILLISTFPIEGCSFDKDSNKTDETIDTSTEKIVLRFAHNWTNGDTKAQYFEPMLKEYAKLHSEVKFIFETTPKMEHKHKIQVDVASGKTPDIFTYWAGSPFASLFQAGVLADLDQYFAISTKTRIEQFEYEMFESLIFDDCKYGIPFEVYKSFLLVNRELFDKAGIKKYPETLEDLISIAPDLNKAGVIPAAFTSKNGDPSHALYSAFLFQYEGEYEKSLNICNTFSFKSENSIKAAEAIEALKKGKVIPEDTIMTGGDEGALALYNKEEAAMMLAFPWMIQMIDPEVAKKSDIIPVPRLADATVDPDTYCIGAVSMGIAVNKNSFADASKKDEIVKFIDYLISDEMFRELAKSGMFPTKKVDIEPDTVPELFLKVAESTKNKELRLHHVKLFPNDDVLNIYLDSLDKLFVGAFNAEEFNNVVQSALDIDRDKTK